MCSILFLFAGDFQLTGQTYSFWFGPGAYNHLASYELPDEIEFCESIEICEMDLEDQSTFQMHGHGSTMTPNGKLLTIFNNEILEFDLLTGSYSVFATLPLPSIFVSSYTSICAMSNTDFLLIFSTPVPPGTPIDTLVIYNSITNTITELGQLPGSDSHGDIFQFNHQYYYWAIDATDQHVLYRLDLIQPLNTLPIIDLPLLLVPSSASPYCNYVFAFFGSSYLLCLFNIVDGSIILLCSPQDFVTSFTSMEEFNTPTICLNIVDLDCDNSSGAVDYDYEGQDVHCHNSSVAISDDDINVIAQEIIEEMTIQLSGFIPDAPFEYLTSGSIPNIAVSGDGTDFITLTNTGSASANDFKDALRSVRYHNDAPSPTPGERNVLVQFTTAFGTESNIATAFIDVVAKPTVQVLLGEDVGICEGTTITLNATEADSLSYLWNTNQTTPAIEVSTAGLYSITVTHPTLCPGADSVQVDVLPNIVVGLSGDSATCANEEIELLISSDAPFPLDVVLISQPGSSITIVGVDEQFVFTDFPLITTLYTIDQVTPSEPACVSIEPSAVWIEVYPVYQHQVHDSICQGDSLWLGQYWADDPGVYEVLFSSVDQCDSIVTFTIDLLPAVQIQLFDTTCVLSESGIFITHINNPNGCDTVLTSIVSLMSLDTTFLSDFTCLISEVGVHADTFLTSDGCDSLVITTLSYSPPEDTTFLFRTSCDPGQIGSIQSLLPSSLGCDSISVTTTTLGSADTTLLFSTSCNLASLGVFTEHFLSVDLCDSIVISTVSFSAFDSTFLTVSSCDPDDVGIFVNTYINRFGCDSIVTLSVFLAKIDSIFLSLTTCDPAQVGVFVSYFTNQQGCDSIITQTVSLLPSHQIDLLETTCLSEEVGVFVSTFLNQHGCDSVVTQTVTLTLIDTTFTSATTCEPELEGITYHTYSTASGCDSTVVLHTILHDLPILVLTPSDYNGYEISCSDAIDGEVHATITGQSPFQLIWSTNDSTTSINSLGPGEFMLTVTDVNGCEVDASTLLEAPPLLYMNMEIASPDCFINGQGSISIQAEGGVAPYRYSIDGGTTFATTDEFLALESGAYEVHLYDANGCEIAEIVVISELQMVEVSLGSDQEIFLGEEILLEANINLPIDSLLHVEWYGIPSGVCDTCLTFYLTPVVSTSYAISVVTRQGCVDRDSIRVAVEIKEIELYIPNVFSPNGDGINDLFMLSAPNEIGLIDYLHIYDRWGNMVFERTAFPPGNALYAWDGTFRHKPLLSAVYAFLLEFKDIYGNKKLRAGNVTLIR